MAQEPDRTAARILRVDHDGEHGAIHIYRAQIALARRRCPELLPFLRETLGHEEEHRARFRALMPARGARPCRLPWLWAGGAAVLGGVTGLFGRRAILVCTEAVERTVHRHLDDQLRYLEGRDPELAETIADIQRQELGHMQHAAEGRGAPRPLDRVLEAVIAGATEALIWASTRGDSVRLARELRGSAGRRPG